MTQITKQRTVASARRFLARLASGTYLTGLKRRVFNGPSNVKIQNGFTLLEIVVAMAIVGLGVVTLLEIFSLGLRLGWKSSVRTESVSYARQVMDEVLIRREVEGVEEHGADGKGHRWTLQVDSFQEESEPLESAGWELKEVTLRMEDQQTRGSPVRMTLLRLVRKEKR